MYGNLELPEYLLYSQFIMAMLLMKTKMETTPTNNLEEFGTNVVKFSPPSGRPRMPDNTYQDGLDEESVAPKRSTQWTEVSKGTYISTPETCAKIKAAVYKYVRFSDTKFAFTEVPVNIDELLVMPDGASSVILDEIQLFLNRHAEFKHHGFLHRRGFLFYGPHGSGKSSLVQQIIKKVIDQDGIVLLCEHPVNLEMGLTDLRQVEPDRFVVCMFEDIDALIQRYGEKEILAVLDGESQINKVLNIATTNYPETLDPRIVARPRRFDKVIKIDWPSDSVRRHYFKHKLKIEDAELDMWVSSTEKFSFAACAELVISVKCLGKPFKDSLAHLKSLMEDKPNSRNYETSGRKPGFGQ
jgi:hypothetical protein